VGLILKVVKFLATKGAKKSTRWSLGIKTRTPTVNVLPKAPSILHPVARAQHRLANLVADDHLMPPVKFNASEAFTDLPRASGVGEWYLEHMISAAKKPEQIQTILSYLRSSAAGNLSKMDRASLIIKISEKSKYLDVLHDILDHLS